MCPSEQEPLSSKRGVSIRWASWAVLLFVGIVALLNIGGATVLPLVGMEYYCWKCTDCGAELYFWPAGDKALVTFPIAYASPRHEWVSTSPEALMFWTWLNSALRRPDPRDAFLRSRPTSDSLLDGIISAYLVESEPLSDRCRGALTVGRPSSESKMIQLRVREVGEEILGGSVDERQRRLIEDRLRRFRLGAATGGTQSGGEALAPTTITSEPRPVNAP